MKPKSLHSESEYNLEANTISNGLGEAWSASAVRGEASVRSFRQRELRREFPVRSDGVGYVNSEHSYLTEDFGADDDFFSDMIATVPCELDAPMLSRIGGARAFSEVSGGLRPQPFCIRAADSYGRRSSASVLVSKMYAWRGYQCTSSVERDANRITLVATDHDVTVGTISIGFDNSMGLLVDDLFAEEVNEMRRAGKFVCEFTKLAIDSVIRSKRLLASLFHVAYLFAHRINGCDFLLIEVNPRHVRYYQKVLGFTVIGPERLNRRVNAPAVLLCLDLAQGAKQVDRFRGQGESAIGEKSLYPYFFTLEEEVGILNRVRRHAPRTAVPATC